MHSAETSEAVQKRKPEIPSCSGNESDMTVTMLNFRLCDTFGFNSGDEIVSGSLTESDSDSEQE